MRGGLRAGAVVVDVGTGADANFSAALLAKFDVTCVGLEPTRRHHPALDRLVQQRSGRFRYVPVALAARAGSLQFYESTQNISGSIFTDHVNVRHDPLNDYAVEAVELAQIFEIAGADTVAVLKLDIEGAEYEVLQTAAVETLRHFEQIAVEFHHRDVLRYAFADTQAVVQRLTDAGFCSFSSDDVNFLFYRRGV